MLLALALLFAYLLGSLPSAVWIGRLVKGIDIREHGSGNAGATNALRVLGIKAGLFVLALDVAKGFLAVVVVASVATAHSAVDPHLIRVLTGSCAIIGHVFPITTGFRGGKGVGTSAGVMLALAPVVTLGALLLWAAIVAITRYVSVASMVSAVSLPVFLMIRKAVLKDERGGALLVFGVLLAIMVLLSHHANIKRLLAGKENRFKLPGPGATRKVS